MPWLEKEKIENQWLVGNIVAFIKFLIENKQEGYNVYNYIDKPDFTMNELVTHASVIGDIHSIFALAFALDCMLKLKDCEI